MWEMYLELSSTEYRDVPNCPVPSTEMSRSVQKCPVPITEMSKSVPKCPGTEMSRIPLVEGCRYRMLCPLVPDLDGMR